MVITLDTGGFNGGTGVVGMVTGGKGGTAIGGGGVMVGVTPVGATAGVSGWRVGTVI